MLSLTQKVIKELQHIILTEKKSLNFWFVIYTKPNAEKKFAERLEKAGFVVYLPLYKELKQWSDRKKMIQKPLISSVVFIHCSEAQLRDIYHIVGFSKVLYYLGKAAIVKAQEIINLQILLQEGSLPDLSIQDIFSGKVVKVVNGPFKGVIGSTQQVLNNLRIRIEIENLGLAFSINVPKSFVKLL